MDGRGNSQKVCAGGGGDARHGLRYVPRSKLNALRVKTKAEAEAREGVGMEGEFQISGSQISKSAGPEFVAA